MSTRRSQICEGSGLDVGRKASTQGKLHAPCPACGASVAIGYLGRLMTHGTTKGQTKHQMVKPARASAVLNEKGPLTRKGRTHA